MTSRGKEGAATLDGVTQGQQTQTQPFVSDETTGHSRSGRKWWEEAGRSEDEGSHAEKKKGSEGNERLSRDVK